MCDYIPDIKDSSAPEHNDTRRHDDNNSASRGRERLLRDNRTSGSDEETKRGVRVRLYVGQGVYPVMLAPQNKFPLTSNFISSLVKASL